MWFPFERCSTVSRSHICLLQCSLDFFRSAFVLFTTLGSIFLWRNPKSKRLKIEHFSSKSSPHLRNMQRMSNFPMVWWHLLTAVYSLEFRFSPINTSLQIAFGLFTMLGTSFFCNPTCKSLKTEHFLILSRNPRNTERMFHFPRVVWFPVERFGAVSRSNICLLQCSLHVVLKAINARLPTAFVLPCKGLKLNIFFQSQPKPKKYAGDV